MAMSELLDELARTLATPIPRWQALRLVGVALVSAALPGGIGKGAATAAAATRTAKTSQKKVCIGLQTGIAPDEFQCPDNSSPAAASVCGTRGSTPDCCGDPTPQCCSDGTLGFPADRNGRYCCPEGCECYKGLCCPPGGPRGSDTYGQPLCCTPGQILRNGRCFDKACGPDITDTLEAALSRTKTTFADWSSTQRLVACHTLGQTAVGTLGWEINQLGPGPRDRLVERYRPECSTCADQPSVQVEGGCHYAGSVNYVVYGVMFRLCHDHFKPSPLRRLFTEDAMTVSVYAWKKLRGAPNLEASLNWAKAGYNDWPARRTPPPELPKCADCPNEYKGRMTVRWLPLDTSI